MPSRLLVPSKRTYVQGAFQDGCCQCCCPHSRPLLTHASAGVPRTLTARSGSVSCGRHCSFAQCQDVHRFCLYPQESPLPPVLCKFCKQIFIGPQNPLPLRFPGLWGFPASLALLYNWIGSTRSGHLPPISTAAGLGWKDKLLNKWYWNNWRNTWKILTWTVACSFYQN